MDATGHAAHSPAHPAGALLGGIRVRVNDNAGSRPGHGWDPTAASSGLSAVSSETRAVTRMTAWPDSPWAVDLVSMPPTTTAWPAGMRTVD